MPGRASPTEAPEAEQLRAGLREVDALRRKRDFLSAHQVLLGAVRRFVEQRYPFLNTQSTPYGFEVTMQGYRLVAVGGTVHCLGRSQVELQQAQEHEINAAMRKLRSAGAKAYLFVVTDAAFKTAVLNRFGGRLEGVDVWSANDLLRLDLPLRG